jgi:hypothetical protein
MSWVQTLKAKIAASLTSSLVDCCLAVVVHHRCLLLVSVALYGVSGLVDLLIRAEIFSGDDESAVKDVSASGYILAYRYCPGALVDYALYHFPHRILHSR